MVKEMKFFWEVVKETFTEWNASSASSDSASLAYYAIFSIPGLLIIIIWIAGYFFGEEAIRGQITYQISGMMGTEVAESVQNMIAGADEIKRFVKRFSINWIVKNTYRPEF